jgi:hypothetical protein
MNTRIEILAFDEEGSYGPKKCAIASFAFGSIPIWWTGGSMTSAQLRPRIKYYDSLDAAKADLPNAEATTQKMLSAQY